MCSTKTAQGRQEAQTWGEEKDLAADRMRQQQGLLQSQCVCNFIDESSKGLPICSVPEAVGRLHSGNELSVAAPWKKAK